MRLVKTWRHSSEYGLYRGRARVVKSKSMNNFVLGSYSYLYYDGSHGILWDWELLTIRSSLNRCDDWMTQINKENEDQGQRTRESFFRAEKRDFLGDWEVWCLSCLRLHNITPSTPLPQYSAMALFHES